MAKSPRKNVVPKITKASKAPGKTILPRHKFAKQKQRRFSLIDSDSSLSEFESEEDERSAGNHSGKFQALQSDSDDEDDDDSSDTNEELWKSHSKKVVNTSSEDEDDDQEEEDDDGDSSSSDDEDVDFVKLTAERKAKQRDAYRSQSPFQTPPPQIKSSKKQQQQSKLKSNEEVSFSFDWNNNNDNTFKLDDEEEDVGEELSNFISPLKHEIPITGDPGIVAIEDSESDGDIDKDEFFRTLDQESDGFDAGIDTGDDDFDLLKEEADNILQDYSTGQLELSSNTTPRNSVVEEMIRKHKAEVNPDEEALQFVSDDDDDAYDEYDDDEEYGDDFMIPFFDDSEFKQTLLYTSEGAMNEAQKRRDLDSEDDSYLWDYFFSDGEGDDDEENGKSGDGNQDNYSDDEATDEDTTLPPPSTRRKVGAKAQELLSSSSIIARPPQLGTWSTDSKPFGIIDGLSTRSLLLTPTKNGTASPVSGAKGPSTPVPNGANVEEFTLDELLNMSELEDSEPETAMNHAAWLEATASTRKVPLSAFRNKGVVSNEALHVNATRRFSLSHNGSATKKATKKKQGRLLDVSTLTPVRAIGKNGKVKRRGSVKKARRQSEAAVEGLRVTKGGLFSEDTLSNVEEFLTGLGGEAELSILLQ